MQKRSMRKGEMMYLLRMFCALIGLFMVGCGAAPGGDTLDGANSDLGLPVSGAAAKVESAWSTFKDGSFTASKTIFSEVINSGDATNLELSEAYSGMAWANVKNSGSSAGIADFRKALEKNEKQPEALVGLAGALISKGDRTSIDESVTLIETLGGGTSSFNFHDRYNVGVSNGEAHAMLAYGYFVQGNRTKSEEQMAIARDLDSSITGSPVDQIDEILSFIP